MSAARGIRQHGGEPNIVRRYLNGPRKPSSSPNGPTKATIDEMRWRLLNLFMQKRSDGVATGISRGKAEYRRALTDHGNGSIEAGLKVDKHFWRLARTHGFEEAEAAIGLKPESIALDPIPQRVPADTGGDFAEAD